MGSQEFCLTQSQRSIIIGSLLGDGTMEINGRYPRLKIDHGMCQKDYVSWLADGLKPIVRKPIVIRYWHKEMEKYYQRLNLSTFSSPVLQDYYQLFFGSGKKLIPKNLDKYLDDLGLAVWFMDDGHKRTDCNALRIHTNAYLVSEVEYLQKVLAEKFGVRSKLHHIRRDVEERTIYIPSGKDTERFIKIVRPHICDSMRYKISLTP